MTRLDWLSPRGFDSGLERGVYYPKNAPGETWNGLLAVTETPYGSDEMTRYIDGVKNTSRRRIGYFSGTIEAYTYPDSFFDNVFVQKRATDFGLSYRSGDKIHLVYNVSIPPSAFKYAPDLAAQFRWDFATVPVDISRVTRTSHVVIDTSVAHSATVSALEDILYGSAQNSARLPSPTEVMDIFEQYSILRVIDHGDGSFTVTGPSTAIQMLDSTSFQITWPSAVYIDEVSYTLSSL
jgi:hypothetical protein